MPTISIDHVVSCNSADKSNPAENLLKSDGTHKWKCATVGEKKISVVLQFNKSSKINSIDIGNEGSAFVEVLVGKATAAADDDFEVLLVASSFMSPIESRNGTNRNSVRMFGPEKLNKQVSDKNWDRVKIVCTQPFSKLHAFGLSFIKFHSLSSGDGEESVKKLGAFTVRDSDDDDIQIGSLFANRSKLDSPAASKVTGAAAVRAATELAEEKTRSTSPAPVALSPSSDTPKERKRPSSPSLSYENNLKAKTPRTSKDGGDDKDTKAPGSYDKLPLKKQSSSLSSVTSTHSRGSRDDKTSLKKTKTEPTRSSPNVKFSKLMEKVVFVLSGFQNPYRGELRDKALEMGANYKPDWGRDCTHLICAFDKTPKYQQVKGKGKIVTKKWILDCHKQRKLLPWRKYRLGDAESPTESSTDEEEYQPPVKAAKPSPSVERTEGKSPEIKPRSGKGIQYTADSDSGGGDTEDELRKANERAKTGNKKLSPPSQKTKGKDPYNDSTDEDDVQEVSTLPISSHGEDSDSGLPDLPDFFSDKHFFFYGDFEAGQQRLLTRYIAAYNGEVEDYMSSKVNFVITCQKWDENFEVALNDNPGIIFVKPRWIVACHDKESLTPYQPHIIVPS